MCLCLRITAAPLRQVHVLPNPQSRTTPSECSVRISEMELSASVTGRK